jgi:hypothetical protein
VAVNGVKLAVHLGAHVVYRAAYCIGVHVHQGT